VAASVMLMGLAGLVGLAVLLGWGGTGTGAGLAEAVRSAVG
jgi:hypothetical protein